MVVVGAVVAADGVDDNSKRSRQRPLKLVEGRRNMLHLAL